MCVGGGGGGGGSGWRGTHASEIVTPPQSKITYVSHGMLLTCELCCRINVVIRAMKRKDHRV